MDSICTIARRKMAGLRFFIGILGWAALAGSSLCRAADDNALKLWYRQPAGAWTQALPVGNGRLAAMVFGDVRQGAPPAERGHDLVGREARPEQPRGAKGRSGNPPSASGRPPGRRRRRWPITTMISIPRALPVYQTMGDLWLDFGDVPDASDYRRELDLDTGIAIRPLHGRWSPLRARGLRLGAVPLHRRAADRR